MEIILVVVAGVLLVAMTGLYMYLIDKNKIEPYVPPQEHRGNFWDAETKKFYKWDELMELKNKKEEKKDDT
jgi:flagellar basal body-associated protein FliL